MVLERIFPGRELPKAKGWYWRALLVNFSQLAITLATARLWIRILSDAILSALVLYPLLGCSLMGAFWYNFFAATGEYFYHANLRTPRWLRFLIQTPELHSIHHQYNVHRYNFSDIPLWDRLFGTYKDTVEFCDRCGFPKGAEERLGAMLAFKDVYVEESA
jgi:hypothetical protein